MISLISTCLIIAALVIGGIVFGYLWQKRAALKFIKKLHDNAEDHIKLAQEIYKPYIYYQMALKDLTDELL